MRVGANERLDMTVGEENEANAIARNLRARVPDVDQLVTRAIREDWPLEKFRKQALDSLPQHAPIQRPLLDDFPAGDLAKYSITRAISNVLRQRPLDGVERELDAELRRHAPAAPQGILVPDAAFAAPDWQTRSFVAGTGTLGGMIVSTPNLGEEFVNLLRNRAQVINLGARVLQLNTPVTIPRQQAAGATNWVGETAAATLSAGSFTQFTLTPHAVSAFQQYSKQLLMTSNPSIDSIIRDDVLQQIGLAIDLAALHGSGGDQPTGIAGTTGIGTVALSSNGLALANTTAYPFLVSLEANIATNNADLGALGYLMRPGHRAALKTVTRFANTDTPVWDAQAGNMPVNGYRAEVTGQIATNLTTGTATTICSAIFFGNWNDLIVAQFGATDLVVDPYTLAVNAVVRIIARRWMDTGLRHPASFAIGGGILTT